MADQRFVAVVLAGFLAYALDQPLVAAVAQQGVAPLGQGGGGALAGLVSRLEPLFLLPGLLLGLAEQSRQGGIVQLRMRLTPFGELAGQGLLLLASLVELLGLVPGLLGEALVRMLGLVQPRLGVITRISGALLGRVELLLPGVRRGVIAESCSEGAGEFVALLPQGRQTFVEVAKLPDELAMAGLEPRERHPAVLKCLLQRCQLGLGLGQFIQALLFPVALGLAVLTLGL